MNQSLSSQKMQTSWLRSKLGSKLEKTSGFGDPDVTHLSQNSLHRHGPPVQAALENQGPTTAVADDAGSDSQTADVSDPIPALTDA